MKKKNTIKSLLFHLFEYKYNKKYHIINVSPRFLCHLGYWAPPDTDLTPPYTDLMPSVTGRPWLMGVPLWLMGVALRLLEYFWLILDISLTQPHQT